MVRLLSLTLLLTALPALSHTRLLSPVPRSTSDSLKDPNGPCGAVPRGANNLPPWTMGQQVTINWEETINHPGCFLLALSPANDANFQLLKNVAHSSAGMTPRPYSTTLTLPAGVSCDNCTLQLRQIMLPSYDGGVCPPPNLPSGSTYFSCADVQILSPDAGGGSVDAGSGGGTGADAGAGGGSGGGAGGGSGGGTGGGGTGSGGAGGGGGSGGAGGSGGGGAGGGDVDAGEGSGGGVGGGTGGSSGGVAMGGDPVGGCAAVPAGSLAALALLLRLRRRRS